MTTFPAGYTAMPLVIKCSRCKQKNTFDDELANETVECRFCHQPLALAGAESLQPLGLPGSAAPPSSEMSALDIPERPPVWDIPPAPKSTSDDAPDSRKPRPIGEEERDELRRRHRSHGGAARSWLFGTLLGGTVLVVLLAACILAPIAFLLIFGLRVRLPFLR
jgi:hypothetical protein